MPIITLPDGSRRSFDNPVSVLAVADDIGPGLAKATLAGRVDGRLVDASYVIENDVDLANVIDLAGTFLKSVQKHLRNLRTFLIDLALFFELG